jgi:hypothetical protein
VPLSAPHAELEHGAFVLGRANGFVGNSATVCGEFSFARPRRWSPLRDIIPVFAEVQADISAFCATDMTLEEFRAEVERDRRPLLVHLFR